MQDQRTQFIAACLAGDVPFAELCREFGVSRKTGYKWRERYAADGPAGLGERTSAPQVRANATPAAIKVRAKGNKEHLVYVTGGARQVLRDWLDRRGDGPGPLFPPISQKGELGVGGMSSHAVYKICLKRAKQAAVRGFALHDARRTFVTQLLEAGADLAAVADLAGHSNVNTTRRYDRRGERAKRQAAERVFVPYVAPTGGTTEA